MGHSEIDLTAKRYGPALALDETQKAEATSALQRLDEAAAEKKPSKGKLMAGLSVVSEVLKTGKAAADLQKPLHDLIEWVSRLMS